MGNASGCQAGFILTDKRGSIPKALSFRPADNLLNLIDGELVFDAIPPIFELEDAIEEAIHHKNSNQLRTVSLLLKRYPV
jgi:hypothetical protein